MKDLNSAVFIKFLDIKGPDEQPALKNQRLTFTYKDKDGDDLQISSNEELNSAYEDAVKLDNSLRICVTFPGADQIVVKQEEAPRNRGHHGP
jgi:hypothetical protein